MVKRRNPLGRSRTTQHNSSCLCKVYGMPNAILRTLYVMPNFTLPTILCAYHWYSYSRGEKVKVRNLPKVDSFYIPGRRLYPRMETFHIGKSRNTLEP